MVSLERYIAGPPLPNLLDKVYTMSHPFYKKLLNIFVNGFNNLIGKEEQTTPIILNAKD